MHIYICTAVSNLMPQESHQKKSISLKYKYFFYQYWKESGRELYTLHACSKEPALNQSQLAEIMSQSTNKLPGGKLRCPSDWCTLPSCNKLNWECINDHCQKSMIFIST